MASALRWANPRQHHHGTSRTVRLPYPGKPKRRRGETRLEFERRVDAIAAAIRAQEQEELAAVACRVRCGESG